MNFVIFVCLIGSAISVPIFFQNFFRFFQPPKADNYYGRDDLGAAQFPNSNNDGSFRGNFRARPYSTSNFKRSLPYVDESSAEHFSFPSIELVASSIVGPPEDKIEDTMSLRASRDINEAAFGGNLKSATVSSSRISTSSKHSVAGSIRPTSTVLSRPVISVPNIQL